MRGWYMKGAGEEGTQRCFTVPYERMVVGEGGEAGQTFTVVEDDMVGELGTVKENYTVGIMVG